MARSKIPIHFLLLVLLLVLVLNPLKTLAGERFKRCANFLRAAPMGAKIALAGVGSGSLLAGGYFAIPQVVSSVNSLANYYLNNTVAEGRLGANYIKAWVDLGKITPVQAEAILNRFTYSHGTRFLSLRARVNQFRDMQLWTKENASIAEAAIAQIDSMRWNRGNMTTDNVRAELFKIDAFKKMLEALPDRVRFTSELLTDPLVTVDGKTDAYWMSVFFDRSRQAGGFNDNQLEALSDLESSYNLHDAKIATPLLISLLADSLTQPDLIRAKASRAADLKVSGAFAYRADIPNFGKPEVYRDLNSRVQLQDELDRWTLIMQNPAFAKIRSEWEYGMISDFKALSQAEDLIRSRTQIFSLDINARLPAKAVCSILYGSKANTLFESIKDLNVPVQVQARLAQIRFSGLVSAAMIEDREKMLSITRQTQDLEKQTLLDYRSGKLRLESSPPCPTAMN